MGVGSQSARGCGFTSIARSRASRRTKFNTEFADLQRLENCSILYGMNPEAIRYASALLLIEVIEYICLYAETMLKPSYPGSLRDSRLRLLSCIVEI